MSANAFSMFAGDTTVLEVTVRDQDGNIVDLTNASARWQLSRSPKMRPAVVEKAIGNGITVIDAAQGRVDVMLLPADTEDLANKGPASFYFELEVIDEQGRVSTAWFDEPHITIRPALIKPAAP